MAGVVAQSTLEYSLAVNAASEIAPFNLIYLALGLALLPFWCALSLLRWVTGQPSADSRLQVGPDIDFHHTDSHTNCMGGLDIDFHTWGGLR